MTRANAETNPEYSFHTFNDSGAKEFVEKHCGQEAGMAYECLRPAAYRADLFRYCALHALGGVYIDDDVFLTQSIEEVISTCSAATIGHDWPQMDAKGEWHEGKQMKILAGTPGSTLFRCMLSSIITHVKGRFYGWSTLGITGPLLLHKCFEDTGKSAAVTYIDSRYARWPYTGLRTSTGLMAFEVPEPPRHWDHKKEEAKKKGDYADAFKNKSVYSTNCQLR